MNRTAAALLAGASLVMLSACQQAPAPPPAKTEAPKPAPPERGKSLVDAVARSDDCHTPHKMGPTGPEPDMTRRLSGHPETEKLPPPPKATGPWMIFGTPGFTSWAGPWGVSYTANLT